MRLLMRSNSPEAEDADGMPAESPEALRAVPTT